MVVWLAQQAMRALPLGGLATHNIPDYWTMIRRNEQIDARVALTNTTMGGKSSVPRQHESTPLHSFLFFPFAQSLDFGPQRVAIRNLSLKGADP